MQSSTWPAVGTSSSGVLVTLNAPLLCAVIEGSSTCGCMHHSTRTGLFAGVKESVTPRPLAALLAARCAVVGLSGGSITSSSSRLWMGAPYICGASVSFVLIWAGSHSRGLAACNGGTSLGVVSTPVDSLAPAMARYAIDWLGSALRFMAWCINAGTAGCRSRLGTPPQELNWASERTPSPTSLQNGPLQLQQRNSWRARAGISTRAFAGRMYSIELCIVPWRTVFDCITPAACMRAEGHARILGAARCETRSSPLSSGELSG
jgi:hypothetical protein